MRHPLSTITQPDQAGEPTCSQCMHLLRRGTCAEPVAAGLTQWFEIHWAPPGHAATCPALQPIAPHGSANAPAGAISFMGASTEGPGRREPAAGLAPTRPRIPAQRIFNPSSTPMTEALKFSEVGSQ